MLGLGRIESVQPVRQNGVFHYLAGLPGYPAATALRRFPDRFARRGKNSLVKLHDVWRAAMLRLWTAGKAVIGEQARGTDGINFMNPFGRQEGYFKSNFGGQE